MVKVSNLSFSYGDRVVFENLNLEFEWGFHAIVGPNGSGKTTLLKIISGILKPSDGNVRFMEKDITRMSRGELARFVTLVSQDYETVFDFTSVEVVLMGRIPHSFFPKREDFKRALEIMSDLNLRDLSYRRFSDLSGGEKRLVLIAKAFLQDPKIVLVDELELHLDPKRKLEITCILRKMVENGKTVIAVFHDLNLALSFSDRLIGLKRGRVVFDLDVQSDEIPHVLKDLYDVNFHGIRLENKRWCVFPRL